MNPCSRCGSTTHIHGCLPTDDVWTGTLRLRVGPRLFPLALPNVGPFADLTGHKRDRATYRRRRHAAYARTVHFLLGAAPAFPMGTDRTGFYIVDPWGAPHGQP